MKELYKIVAFINVYQTQVYGYRTVGLDTGKNNLYDYFCRKMGWSFAKLKRHVKQLREAGVLDRVPSDPDCTCLKISTCRQLVKISLKFAELDLVESN